MKKVLSIICVCLIAVMLMSLVACESQDINGKYKMVEMYRDGKDYSDALSSYTDDTIPTLTINGTEAVSVMDGVTDTFVIDYQAKTMTTNGTAVPYSVSGNRITISSSDNSKKMIFEKVEE